MATPTIDVSALNAISKEVFPEGDAYWFQLDRKTPGLDLIEQSNVIPFDGNVSSDGKYLVFPVATAGSANPAVGSSGELAGLPAAGRVDLDRLLYNHSKHIQALEISGDAIDTIIGGNASTQDGLQLQMREQMPEARKEFNRLVHGDGSGAVCVPTAIASGNTFTVPDSSVVKVGTHLILRGDTSGTAYTGSPTLKALKVSSITNSTTFVVTDQDGTAVSLTNDAALANYTLYRYDSQGRAINGFGIMCSDADPTNWGSSSTYYGGISRSSNDWWKAYRLNANSGTISIQNHIQPWIDAVRRRAGEFLAPAADGTVWYAFTGYQNFRTLGNALKADQRTAPNYMTLKGGYSGIEYEGAVFVRDDDAPPSKIRFVHPKSCRRYVLKSWFWDDRTGSIWSRRTAADGRDADVFKAYMYTRQQMISVRSKTMGEIYGTSATS